MPTTRRATPTRTCAARAQGVHAFLRAYFHHKSADWKANKPFRLERLDRRRTRQDADVLHHGPGDGMAETVAKEMPSAAEIAACRWMTEAELRVFSEEYARTTSRAGSTGTVRTRRAPSRRSWSLFSGRTIDMPSCFIAGRERLGHLPGARRHRADAERRPARTCSAVHLIEGAGHWVQQERPVETAQHVAFNDNQTRCPIGDRCGPLRA